MSEVPIFGEQLAVAYTLRQGAYIIIEEPETKKIILVQAPNGAYFLPGGEIEGTETKVEAVHREVMEELGFEVVIGKYLGQADEYFYSRHRDTYYHNPGYFFVAKSWQRVGAPLEAFNVVKWFTVAEARRQLKRGSHQWALLNWLQG